VSNFVLGVKERANARCCLWLATNMNSHLAHGDGRHWLVYKSGYNKSELTNPNGDTRYLHYCITSNDLVSDACFLTTDSDRVQVDVFSAFVVEVYAVKFLEGCIFCQLNSFCFALFVVVLQEISFSSKRSRRLLCTVWPPRTTPSLSCIRTVSSTPVTANQRSLIVALCCRWKRSEKNSVLRTCSKSTSCMIAA